MSIAPGFGNASELQEQVAALESELIAARAEVERLERERERDELAAALRELLVYAEHCAVKIENEWGMYVEDIHELESRGDLPSEIRSARALLARIDSEAKP